MKSIRRRVLGDRSGKQVGVLAILGFTSILATAVVFPNIGSFVRDRFVLSDTEASLFAVSYLIPHVIFAFIWGAISDRTGWRRRLLVIGFVSTAIFHFTLPFAMDYPILLLVRVGEGASSILGFSIVMTMAVDIAKRTNYGRVMGLMGGVIMLGNTLAFAVGGAIGSRSMVLLCSLGAAALLACAILAARFLHPPEAIKAGSFRAALLVVRRTPRLLLPYTFTFVDRFTVGFFAVTFPLYALTVHGLDAAASGLLLAAFLLPFALLTYVFGRLSDRVGGIRPLLIGSFFYGIAVLFVGSVRVDMLLPLLILCGILASAMYAPSLWLVARNSPAERRASAMGGFNAAGSVGFALGPMAGGIVSDLYGYPAAFVVAGLSEILLVLAVLPLVRRLRIQETELEPAQ